ncbi:hypothetical protein ACH5RR_036237 [Cinchona calisaya]|uniref:Disease resistance R13L4/SHOC-2-like LRR domain-containing protein n=1 Tax=Cinchona calisaya TaxID=153742 RepID=A0ABD2Y3V0_9GENT
MAYVAIASLLQNLEYLLQFPCIILQVKKMQAKTFRDKAFPVMWFLNTNLIYPKDDLEILQKYIENLSLPIAKYVKAVNCNDEVVSQIFEITKSVFGIYRGSQWVSEKVLEMLEQASQISEQVNFIESELNRFIEQTRTKWKTTPCLVVEEVLDILLASHFLMQEITFFHEVIMQTMVLCQNLRFFMTLLGESSNKCHDPQVLRSLENVADRARNFVEDCMIDNPIESEMKYFLDVVNNIATYSLARETNLEKVVKDIFVGQEGVSQYLFQTLEEIHYLKGEIRKRRLSFQLNSDGDVHLAPPYPHLRSFLCFTLGSDFVPDIFFSSLQFKLLRVLDMFFLHFDSFPSQVLELTNLRHLALYVTYRLPISISKLLKLQTLIIHGPWNSRKVEEIQTLSLEYWNMPQLRHLYITVASCLSDPSLKTYILLKQYSKIKPEAARDLQTLSTISFASCKCEIFCAMPHLKKLAICETKQDYSRDSSSDCLNNLIFLQELETLKCSFYLERKRAWRILSWNAIPSGLKQLTLSQSYLPWKNMTFVAKLPNLEVLKLKSYAFQGPEWVPTEAGFCSLKHLLIEESDLVIWEATSNDFPRLQYLILKSCKMLLEIPYSVGAISALQRIELHYCSKSSEISAKNIQDQIDGLDIMIRSD